MILIRKIVYSAFVGSLMVAGIASLRAVNDIQSSNCVPEEEEQTACQTTALSENIRVLLRERGNQRALEDLRARINVILRQREHLKIRKVVTR